jgi:hypothetical protein
MNIVIWGHKLYTHTHSFIHCGFFKAFKHLGYKTYHFDDSDDRNEFNFSDSLFITEGQVDKNIPIRKDCKYILHNCDQIKYRETLSDDNILTLQVYNNTTIFKDKETKTTQDNIEKIEDCIYYEKNQRLLYMPWATDLLPHEIEELNSIPNRNKEVYWIGSVGNDDKFGNQKYLDPYFEECRKHNIVVKFINPWSKPVSFDENRKLIKHSYLAPSIQGDYQINVGYVPCRIFKNISYGQFGITNSKEVYDLFNKEIVYDTDSVNLFNKSMEYFSKENLLKDLKAQMNFVKENHTYINRINTLLKFF